MKKKSIKFYSCTILFATTSLYSFSQDVSPYILKKTLQTAPVKSISIDRYSNVFIGDDKGNLFRYDSLGRESLRYSPQKKAEISILEAWRSVNIFLFYRELQEYSLLDRFLTTSNPNFKFINEVQNTETSVGFARLATIASDNNLWIYDEVDFSIKKYSTTTNTVLITTPLELILDPRAYDLTFIREYQNLLFISDKNSGILIFDNLGNYKTKLEVKGLSYFNFFDNYIYYLSDGKLVMIDIYKGENRTFTIPQDKVYTQVLLSNTMAYFFGKDYMEIFLFNPKK